VTQVGLAFSTPVKLWFRSWEFSLLASFPIPFPSYIRTTVANFKQTDLDNGVLKSPHLSPTDEYSVAN